MFAFLITVMAGRMMRLEWGWKVQLLTIVLFACTMLGVTCLLGLNTN